jgi:hypothetical protein
MKRLAIYFVPYFASSSPRLPGQGIYQAPGSFKCHPKAAILRVDNPLIPKARAIEEHDKRNKSLRSFVYVSPSPGIYKTFKLATRHPCQDSAHLRNVKAVMSEGPNVHILGGF